MLKKLWTRRRKTRNTSAFGIFGRMRVLSVGNLAACPSQSLRLKENYPDIQSPSIQPMSSCSMIKRGKSGRKPSLKTDN